jgi:gamma-glutamylcyclotransferase (GGCT)/AIG2-like uncharacterized protein YtfP
MPSTSALPLKTVFVYGTLRKGESNDITRLTPPPIWVGQASIAGRLFHLGRYPGIILGGSQQVVGEIYRIDAELELKLDEIEMLYPTATDEYFKRRVAVQFKNQPLDCIVYEINPSYTTGKPVIEHGDWVRRHA